MDVRTRGFYRRTPVDEALNILLKRVSPIGQEFIDISVAVGRVLGEDLTAKEDIPPFDRAAMDGYAVKGENTFGASQTNPIYFKVIGEASIGKLSKLEVREFEAVRIMTGSPMPKGANAVVMFEHTNELDGEIEVLKPVPPGKNVSRKGEDVKKGGTLLKKGRVLKPQDVGMLAALGMNQVKVQKKPSVSIISSGDELTPPGETLQEGKIYDINSYSLASYVKKLGGIPYIFGIVRDKEKDISNAILKSLQHDMIIISGSTSVGKRDIVPKIVSEMGKILVHGVAIRPGEPTGFGIISDKIVFMLPGYPVAAIVGFETFVRPALQKMQGTELKSPYPKIKAYLSRKISSELGRRDFARVRIWKEGDKLIAEPVRTKGSGIISSLVKADGFIIVPENTEGLEKGTEIEVNLFDRY
jgi:molybdenum cofactor synthesis domain-containing protein